MASGMQGQESKHAISGRVGLSSGIAYQLMVDDFRGYKGMMSFRDGGIQITALIESYRPLYLKFTDKMYYYTGMGAHIGFTRWPHQRGFIANPFRYYRGKGHFAPVIGMDAIIGLEFRLSRIPLTFSLDAKPFFELFGQNIFRLSLFDIGLSVKIHF
jgi:hypothetical protein